MRLIGRKKLLFGGFCLLVHARDQEADHDADDDTDELHERHGVQRAGGSGGHCHAGGGLLGHAGDEHGHEDGDAERSAHILEDVERAGSGGGLSRSNAGQRDLHEDGGVAAEAEACV